MCTHHLDRSGVESDGAFGAVRFPFVGDDDLPVRFSDRLRTRQRTLDVLDAIRFRHNPADDWDAFFDALWDKRSTIRGHPDPS